MTEALTMIVIVGIAFGLIFAFAKIILKSVGDDDEQD